MLGTRRHLRTDVGQHHVERHHPKLPLIDRHNRTVATEVLTPSRGLGRPAAPACPVRHPHAGVILKRRQARSIRLNEAESGHPHRSRCLGRHGGIPTRLSRGDTGSAGQGSGECHQCVLKLTAQNRRDALLTQPRLIERRVEAVPAQVRIRIEAPHPGQQRFSQPGRGVHLQVHSDE